MALENVYYFGHFFFFPISSKWSQWLLSISLEKLKDMNIFLAPSIEKDRQKWLAYWEQPALCDEESVWFAEDLKTMMQTRALSKWVLMKSRLQENTFLCVLHSVCLVQVCRGGQRNLNPYLVVTAVLIVNRAGKKDGHGVSAMLLLPPNPANTTAFKHIIEISNIATFPFSEGQVTPAVAWLDNT